MGIKVLEFIMGALDVCIGFVVDDIVIFMFGIWFDMIWNSFDILLFWLVFLVNRVCCWLNDGVKK